MTSVLSHLAPPEGARTKPKRLGRGVGTGLGKTAGRGQKGQKARSTGNIGKKHFQGGQTPIQRRLPKRGFRNPFARVVSIVNVRDLERFGSGVVVDEQALRDQRLVQLRKSTIKVLGNGELTKALTVHAHAFSKTAEEKIVQAGGKVVRIEDKPAPETAG